MGKLSYVLFFRHYFFPAPNQSNQGNQDRTYAFGGGKNWRQVRLYRQGWRAIQLERGLNL